jgi:nitroimidazol reductase NimA-like FMN-containing flavoprotein (pyridoxamine 5'-phosphate oxidase superfamily)
MGLPGHLKDRQVLLQGLDAHREGLLHPDELRVLLTLAREEEKSSIAWSSLVAEAAAPAIFAPQRAKERVDERRSRFKKQSHEPVAKDAKKSECGVQTNDDLVFRKMLKWCPHCGFLQLEP